MSTAPTITPQPDAPRRCVVLGGSGALGRVVCESLAEQQARVVLTYWQGEEVATELCRRRDNLVARRLDVTQIGVMEQLLADAAGPRWLGGLDALVHCAAIGEMAGESGSEAAWSLAEVTEASWDRLMAVNLKSAFFACRQAASLMGEQGGNLVLVGSIDAVKPVPAKIDYATSKAGLLGMTRALAKELGARGIRVNAVVPGVMEAGLSSRLPERIRQDYLAHCALKRPARLVEVAELIAWLALENTYVTGQAIVLDGGL